MNMNLKGIMKTLGAQMGEVVSNPYARAFAPQPSVKEEVVNEEDHEVSMAQNQLDSIIKNATELKGKIGEMEKNIPGWIQDHITNSENYIEQANTGYHELEESLNEEFKHIIHVDTPTQVVSKPIAAQILALAKKGVRSKDIGLEMGFVGNQKLATDAFQKVKNKIYFELGKKNESLNEAVDFRDGKYRFYSKDGVGYLTYDGKELSSGDFDWEDGSNSYWMSHSSFKGQKAFDTGKDVINYFKSKKITTESVNEGKFKKDDLVYNKRTKTVGIVRLGDDKYGEVKTDADGNVNVDELEKYNPIKHKHQQNAKVAPSTEREVNSRGLFNPFKAESVNETRLTDIVNSIIETPVIGKMIRTEAKKYDIGSGWMGNGLTIWNRAEEEHGDYKIIAHISPDGKLSIRDKQLPSDIKKMFQMWADTMKKGDRPGIY